MRSILEHIDEILNRVSEATKATDSKKLERVVYVILRSQRIFFVGVGRSGLIARFAAHRLAHMGFRVYVVGETITPAATAHDTLIAISGSGESEYTVNIAEKAHSLGAYIIAITANPDSRLVRLANTTIFIPAKRESLRVDEKDFLVRQIIGSYEPFSSESGIFEIAATVVLEAITRKLSEILAENTLTKRVPI